MQHPILAKKEQIRDLEEHLRWLRSMETGYERRTELAEKELQVLKDEHP